MVRLAVLLVIAVLAPGVRAAFAQSPAEIFTAVDGGLATGRATRQNGGAPLLARHLVGMRLDRLFDVPSERVLLNLDAHTWTARLERLDIDVAGHRAWVGTLEGLEYSHVAFVERHGVVSGVINAMTEQFRIRTVTPGAYLVEQIDSAHLGTELAPLSAPALSRSSQPLMPAADDDGSTVDVLFLYTPAAQAHLGGTAQMQALIAQIVSDSNTISARSGIPLALRSVGGVAFPITETGDMAADLRAVTESPVAHSLRDEYRADLVQLLEFTPNGTGCGVAWLLQSLTVSDFTAYSVADVECAVQYTPTHEMAHNMGSHHAPEDGASDALFDYSYGYKDPVRGFRTVMAYACVPADCPRIPNMSSPDVAHGGAVTGTRNQNNALSIRNAARTVANFRRSTLNAGAPAAPSNVTATLVGRGLTVAWQPPTSGPVPTSYRVVFYSGGSIVASMATGASSITISLPSFVAGTFEVSVTAVAGAVDGPPSARAAFAVSCSAPAAPISVRGRVEAGVATLTWAPDVNAGGYVVQAGTAPGLSDLFNGNVGPVTSVSAPVSPGFLAFVRVIAVNECGASVPSAEVLLR